MRQRGVHGSGLKKDRVCGQRTFQKLQETFSEASLWQAIDSAHVITVAPNTFLGFITTTFTCNKETTLKTGQLNKTSENGISYRDKLILYDLNGWHCPHQQVWSTNNNRELFSEAQSYICRLQAVLFSTPGMHQQMHLQRHGCSRSLSIFEKQVSPSWIISNQRPPYNT